MPGTTDSCPRADAAIHPFPLPPSPSLPSPHPKKSTNGDFFAWSGSSEANNWTSRDFSAVAGGEDRRPVALGSRIQTGGYGGGAAHRRRSDRIPRSAPPRTIGPSSPNASRPRAGWTMKGVSQACAGLSAGTTPKKPQPQRDHDGGDAAENHRPHQQAEPGADELSDALDQDAAQHDGPEVLPSSLGCVGRHACRGQHAHQDPEDRHPGGQGDGGAASERLGSGPIAADPRRAERRRTAPSPTSAVAPASRRRRWSGPRAVRPAPPRPRPPHRSPG